MRLGIVLTCALALCATTLPALAGPSGTTFDFAAEKGERPARSRTWKGRAWIPLQVMAEPGAQHPLVIFMHGLNRDRVPFRWMGVPADPDVRKIVGSLVDSGRIEAPIVVAPTTTFECDIPRSMWPEFDLPWFLGLALRNLEPRVAVDRSRILLVGHSGAGCNTSGGMLSAVRSGVPLRAVLVIDTCMDPAAGPLLALTPSDTDVVVTWQPFTWDRPIDDFTEAFLSTSRRRQARGLRSVLRYEFSDAHPHNAMVALSLERWLPVWLPATAPSH